MRIVKRIMALAIVVMMLTALCVSVSAADNSGSITINKTVANATYEVYKIFNVEEIDGVYFYKPAPAWEGFFAPGHDGSLYGSMADTGYIVWLNQSLFDASNPGAHAAAIAAFTMSAQEHAEEENLTPDVTAKSASTSLKIEGLTNGAYYLVDSSLGATAIAGPVSPTFAIDEKNSASSAPIISKTVGTEGAEYISVDVGAEFPFVVEVVFNEAVPQGSNNISFTFEDTFSSYLKVVDGSMHAVLNGTNELVRDTDYMVTTSSSNGSESRIITFKKDMAAGDKLVLTYKAKLVANGDTLPVAHEMYTNLARVYYGDRSVSDTASVFTLGVNVHKYYMNDVNVKTSLAAADFVLKNAAGLYYRFENNAVSWVSNLADATTCTSGSDGKLSFYGICKGSYTLVETDAPEGFTGANEKTVSLDRTSVEIEVENIKGTVSVLPETGGMGTTIFYVLGAILVVGAGTILVARKRREEN